MLGEARIDLQSLCAAFALLAAHATLRNRAAETSEWLRGAEPENVLEVIASSKIGKSRQQAVFVVIVARSRGHYRARQYGLSPPHGDAVGAAARENK
jgi:hypothetical protein